MGPCERCGTCCVAPYEVLVSISELRLLEQFGGPLGAREARMGNEIVARLPVPCPFYLDGCTVYKNRPYVCRAHACGKLIARDHAKVHEMQDEAMAWGERMGWGKICPLIYTKTIASVPAEMKE